MNWNHYLFRGGLWVAVVLAFIAVFALYPNAVSERDALLFAVLVVGIWTAARFLQGRAISARDPRGVYPLFIFGGACIVGCFGWAFIFMYVAAASTSLSALILVLAPALLLLVAGAIFLGVGLYRLIGSGQ